jgi:hypothetical protein
VFNFRYGCFLVLFENRYQLHLQRLIAFKLAESSIIFFEAIKIFSMPFTAMLFRSARISLT